MILGFDPGRNKCGIAVIGANGQLHYHQVILATDVDTTIIAVCQQFPIAVAVIGNQTTSKTWKQKLGHILPESVTIVEIDERNSSLEARDRYWEMYPPKGLFRFIPVKMRLPPRPIDDIAAILLIERYLKNSKI